MTDMKHLYLDIDGTILTKRGCREANHLDEFLRFAVEKYDCHWLTTHCKGDASSPLRYLEDKVSQTALALLGRFKPTTFGVWKTEGIDFGSDFVWLDDYAFDGERAMLRKNDALHKLILIDLEAHPNQLRDIITDRVI